MHLQADKRRRLGQQECRLNTPAMPTQSIACRYFFDAGSRHLSPRKFYSSPPLITHAYFYILRNAPDFATFPARNARQCRAPRHASRQQWYATLLHAAAR